MYWYNNKLNYSYLDFTSVKLPPRKKYRYLKMLWHSKNRRDTFLYARSFLKHFATKACLHFKIYTKIRILKCL
jgi:hypothetical protein